MIVSQRYDLGLCTRLRGVLWMQVECFSWCLEFVDEVMTVRSRYVFEART